MQSLLCRPNLEPYYLRVRSNNLCGGLRLQCSRDSIQPEHLQGNLVQISNGGHPQEIPTRCGVVKKSVTVHFRQGSLRRKTLECNVNLSNRPLTQRIQQRVGYRTCKGRTSVPYVKSKRELSNLSRVIYKTPVRLNSLILFSCSKNGCMTFYKEKDTSLCNLTLQISGYPPSHLSNNIVFLSFNDFYGLKYKVRTLCKRL